MSALRDGRGSIVKSARGNSVILVRRPVTGRNARKMGAVWQMGLVSVSQDSKAQHAIHALQATTGWPAICSVYRALPARERECAHQMAIVNAGKAGRGNLAIFVKARAMGKNVNFYVSGIKHVAVVDIVVEMEVACAKIFDRGTTVMNARRDFWEKTVSSFALQLIHAQVEDVAWLKAHANVATSMLGQIAQAAWMAILEVSARPSVTTSRPATRGEDV